MPIRRRRLGIAPVLAAAISLAAGTGAQAQSPSPAVCAQPNVPAHVVWAAPPYIWDNFKREGIMGDVKMLVSLDEQSHVIDVEVQSSANTELNIEAIPTARFSVFQTEVRDCRTVESSFPSP